MNKTRVDTGATYMGGRDKSRFISTYHFGLTANIKHAAGQALARGPQVARPAYYDICICCSV